MSGNIFTSAKANEDHWISVADLMSGLMIIFLFIAVVYMRPILIKQDRIEEIVNSYKNTELSLYNALLEEFKADLDKWNAEIDKETLSVRFKEPEVLFETGQSDLKVEFQDILKDFFPRYASILEGYKQNIDEIRIEGHTSSLWGTFNTDEAYYKNMTLSQSRTRVVLKYCLELSKVEGMKDWLRKSLTANGLSSSHLIYDKDGKENRSLSRRVEFRVKTNAKEKIAKIIEEIED